MTAKNIIISVATLASLGIFLSVATFVKNRNPAIAAFDQKMNAIARWASHPKTNQLLNDGAIGKTETRSGPDFGQRDFAYTITIKKTKDGEDIPQDNQKLLTISVTLGEFLDTSPPEYIYRIGPILNDRTVTLEEFNGELREHFLPEFSPMTDG